MQLIEEFPFKRRRNCIYKLKNDEKGNHFHYDMQISIYVYKHLYKDLRIPNENVNELKYKLVWRMDQS
jgi:hypothetical protein